MVEHLDNGSFKDFIAKGKVVVDYWAEWCGPCKMLGPIFEELSKEMTDIKFAKVNVDENQDLSAEAAVRGIPTSILYNNGTEVGRIVGFLPKDALKQKIEDSFK